MNFSDKDLFSKGVVYGEFYDIATDQLTGYSRYLSDFATNGSFNDGAIEGGPGNMLVMNIPDSSRLAFTVKTADDKLENHALTVGSTIEGNGIIETLKSLSATGTQLKITDTAVAPYGGQNGAIAYVLSSSGTDSSAVGAKSGTPYPVASDGTVTGFTAVSGNTYCVKYFTRVSSALEMKVAANFQPKIVRAHFAVNLYAKGTSGNATEGTKVKVRHYFIPYYFFTNPLQDNVNQTSPGSVDLSGNCLSYEEVDGAVCGSNMASYYCCIVDEYVGDNSTGTVDGIYFIGAGSGVSVANGSTAALTVKYSVNGVLTNISDMSQVTFSTAAEATAKFADEHVATITGVAAGNTTATASVTNSVTGVTYTDTIPVTVT